VYSLFHPMLMILMMIDPEGLRVEATRAQFQVGEPIYFRVTTEFDCFLYIFNLDRKTGKLLLVFPDQPSNRYFLTAGRTRKLPNDSWFVGDHADAEHFVFLATREPMVFTGLSREDDFGLFSVPLGSLSVHHQSGTVTEIEVFIND